MIEVMLGRRDGGRVKGEDGRKGVTITSLSFLKDVVEKGQHAFFPPNIF